jgi:hypothetical protein
MKVIYMYRLVAILSFRAKNIQLLTSEVVKRGVVVHTCNPSYSEGMETGRITQ